MYYSETKVIMGGLAHVPVLIFIVNFIKGKFGDYMDWLLGKIIFPSSSRGRGLFNL